MIPEGQLGVAVSGGADSVALLYLLAEAGFPLTVLHVNHQLRGAESAADQEFVSQIAGRLGLPFLLHLTAPLEGNLEQAARQARYLWFRDLIRAGTVNRVATGHTMDDQAETVLFRFLRGSGTAGLAAIRSEAAGIIRPLLETRRGDLREYLQSRKIEWREDSSNQTLSFRRNRIRHELLPSLESNWNANLTAALARTADWAQAEEAYWDAELPRLTASWVRFEKQSVILDSRALAELPTAAARRVIRNALEHVQGDLRQIDFAQVERIRFLTHSSFRTKLWVARQSAGRLHIARPGPVLDSYRISPEIPGSYRLPNQPARVSLELKAAANVYNNEGKEVDWALVSGFFELRSWQPGDCIQPAGHRTSRKLKRFFQEAGIPSWERSGWPVLTCNNAIVWTRGLGVAAAFLPSTATREVLLIHESPNQNV